MFGSHSPNQDEFTVSFISRRKYISLILRELFEFEAYANLLDHLDCSHGAQAVLFSPTMKAIGKTYACAISLDHLNFRLYMFGSLIFLGSCSNFELLQILLIIRIAIMV